MSPRAYSLLAGTLFLLVALAHVVRIAFGASLVIDGWSVPQSASIIGAAVTGFLSYEGFRTAQKSPPTA